MKLFIAMLPAIPALAQTNAQTNAGLKEQVRKTEIAFAKTMADRDVSAFAKFLSKDIIFTPAMSSGPVRDRSGKRANLTAHGR